MWQVVSMAVHRYMIVVYPLHMRLMLSKRHTFTSITVVYSFSLLLSVPHFVYMRINTCRQPHDNSIYLEISSLGGGLLLFYIRWLWPVLAVFIPVIILIFCNCRLVKELHRTVQSRGWLSNQSSCKSLSRSNSSSYTTHLHSGSIVVTLTLVVIVLIAIFLVAPAEVIRYINPYKSWQSMGQTIALVGNLLQTIGFASNFLLYCSINNRFRQTLRDMLSCPTIIKGVWKKTRSSRANDNACVLKPVVGAVAGNANGNNGSAPLMLNSVKSERLIVKETCT